MKKNKLTLSIFIPAYNEEANIRDLLDSISRQKSNNYELKEIVVSLDACTDNTDKEVRKEKRRNKIIKLIVNKDRKGKYFRLNEAFHKSKTDLLVVVDADIALESNEFLERLIKPFFNDNILMVSAQNLLIKPKTFVGKAIYTNLLLWDNVRLSIPNLNTALSYYGTATAYRSDFTSKLNVSPKLKDPHLYIYLMANKKNGFIYSSESKVYQWPISTWEDYKKLLRRSIGKTDPYLVKLFGKNYMDVYFVPRIAKIKGLFKTFTQEPFFTLFAVVLTVYTKFTKVTEKANDSPIWEINDSTKKKFLL